MMDLDSQYDELPELHRRLTILKIATLLIMALLVARLWYLQIHEGRYYRDLSVNNRTRSVILEPARGLIYDRNGVLLANNVPSFGLYVTLEDVKDREEVIQRLVGLIGLDEALLRKKLSSPGSNLMPRRVKEGLTLREAALIEFHRPDLPGVRVQAVSQRNYLAGKTAAHLLGYVGEVSASQLERPEYTDLHQGSIVGQDGVERANGRVLRGRAGEKVIEMDAMGHEERTISTEKPVAGDDLYLTIDLRLQQLAEQLLGEEAGAIVAIDPTNGEIWALASRPAFDPNVLSRELTPEQWEEIVQDNGHPLTNRATQGLYPPGSTFKIIMAAAALETGTVSDTTEILCKGGYQFGRRFYRDWKAGGHGHVDVRVALIDSCDVFFYTVGQRMGIDTIAAYAERFGLGSVTGVGLPSEHEGIVPSTTWKLKFRNEPWIAGETISASIGQGYVTVTPIQMAQVVAAVANDGVAFRPRLVKGIMARSSGQLQELSSVPRWELNLNPETLKLIKASLVRVVKEGTGVRANSSLVLIAGKTGTAQTVAIQEGPEEDIPKKLRDHAWFVSYAPADSPQIAVAVLVEHKGHGGSAAAPLARQLIERYMMLKQEDGPGSGRSPRSPMTAWVTRGGL